MPVIISPLCPLFLPSQREHCTPRTDQACCAELTDISFSSNLPVVIVNTGGVTPSRTKITAELCTCSMGLKHGGDFSGNVTVHVKGGTDTRMCFQ